MKKNNEIKEKVNRPFKFKIMRTVLRPKPRDFYGFFTDEQWNELRNFKMKNSDDREGVTEIECLIPKEEFFERYLEFCEPEEIKVKALKKDDKVKDKTLKKSSSELFNTDPVLPVADAIATKEIKNDDIIPDTLHEVSKGGEG